MKGPGVLITRPAAQAGGLASLLQARGYRPILAPGIAIEIAGGPRLDLSDFAALAVTSANGVEALDRRSTYRGLKVFAVGEATAQAARKIGFREVVSAEGDVISLEALIRAQFTPDAGKLLHVSGADVAGDLVGALRRAGLQAERTVLYRAVPATALPAEAREAIAGGEIAATLLMSARTATAFGHLLEEAGLANEAARMDALCLSAAVAAAARACPYRNILIADTPTQAAMIALLETSHAPR